MRRPRAHTTHRPSARADSASRRQSTMSVPSISAACLPPPPCGRGATPSRRPRPPGPAPAPPVLQVRRAGRAAPPPTVRTRAWPHRRRACAHHDARRTPSEPTAHVAASRTPHSYARRSRDSCTQHARTHRVDMAPILYDRPRVQPRTTIRTHLRLDRLSAAAAAAASSGVGAGGGPSGLHDGRSNEEMHSRIKLLFGAISEMHSRNVGARRRRVVLLPRRPPPR